MLIRSSPGNTLGHLFSIYKLLKRKMLREGSGPLSRNANLQTKISKTTLSPAQTKAFLYLRLDPDACFLYIEIPEGLHNAAQMLATGTLNLFLPFTHQSTPAAIMTAPAIGPA